jgi:predicted glycoside hydrolase/deacetylase ChbG (UPF0249 family)
VSRSTEKLLVVNADDLGRTPGINSGIFEAHSNGLVTSATLMVAFPAAEEATSRLDSHHHSHRQPVVCDALVTLATEHDLPIRNASSEVGVRLRLDGVATTDFFVEDFFGGDARLDILIEILGGIQLGTTEIMCHPAHVDEELRSTSEYADDRERGLEVLTSPLALQAVRDLGLRPVHFGTAWRS